MPAHLMGLLAIGTFYLITVVVGMCATRCLTDDEEEDEEGGGGRRDDKHKSPDDTGEDTLHLLRLLEQSLPDMVTGKQNRRTNNTPFEPARQPSGGNKSSQYDQSGTPLDLLSRHTESTAPNSSQYTAAKGSREDMPNGSVGRPRFTIKSHSSDTEVILDTTMSPVDPADLPYMAVSHSVPMELGSQHTIMSHMPQIMSGRHHLSMESVDSSRPPPLPTGGRYLLADRNIGWIIGTVSMLAIKTGGIFPAAIAEEAFAQGLLWCQLPIAGALSIVVGGTLFARAMYSEGFITVMDPFQQVYGNIISATLILPLLIADVLYSCVIISSLSHIQHLALGIDPWIGAVSSTAALLCYMLIGGFYAATFTDSLQYIYLLLGLLILTPSILLSDLKTKSIFDDNWRFLGDVNGKNSGIYIDQFVMLILGGVPMQSYFQRMFSCRTAAVSNRVTILASIGTVLTGIPTVFIGLAAHSIEWQNTTLSHVFDHRNVTDAHLVLPFAMSYAVPAGVKMMALGALTSGLLASCDSSIFGLSTILSHNFYRCLFNPKATTSRITWLTRLFTTLVTLLVLSLCLAWPNWYKHWMIPFDILYVFVFPQLFCVVYFKYANTYGALCGLWVSSVVRWSFGERSLQLDAILQLPFYTHAEGQLFPYRTLAMLANLITIIVVSAVVEQMVKLGILKSSQNVCTRASRNARNMSLERRTPPLSPSQEVDGRRRVNRYVAEEYGGRSPTSARRLQLSGGDAAPMTISSLYRHADGQTRSRRNSPLIEKMTVL